jgi:Zn finger protein HypA/HybF involved in hydrogenase expression
MHEWKITEAVVEEVLAQSKKHQMQKVEKVVLSYGGEGDLKAEEIEFCFKAIAEDTILHSVNLDIMKREGGGGIIVESIEGEK